MVHHDSPLPTREEVIAATSRPAPQSLKLAALILAAVGAIVFVVGAVQGNARVWQALLVNWLFFATLASAGVMFVAAQRITTARWSRPVIRMLEGYVAFLPVAFLLLALLVLVGPEYTFSWAITPPTVPEKARYLAPGFFAARTLGVFLLITLLSLWFIYTSVRLDVMFSPEGGARWGRWLRARMRRSPPEERRAIHSTHSFQGKLAIILAIAFAFGWTVLAWDLSMTLDLHFQSALYGWWFFMGGWLAALMSFALLVMWWRRYLGIPHLITEHHFHDLGKLCFAFTAFWGYLTFGQYLVIWYGNMAEETHWMRLRLIEGWKPWTVAAVTMVFAIPFFGLLSRYTKVVLPWFISFAVLSLAGMWLVRYLEVYPSLHGVRSDIMYNVWELGVTLGVLGLFLWSYLAFMDAFPKMRVVMLTSPYRDEVQVPVDPETMEPLPAHE